MAKETKRRIMITKDGPYLVYGGLPIDKQIIGIGKEDEPEKWRALLVSQLQIRTLHNTR